MNSLDLGFARAVLSLSLIGWTCLCVYWAASASALGTWNNGVVVATGAVWLVVFVLVCGLWDARPKS